MISSTHKCHAVTQQIMSCFALGLDLPEGFFREVTAQKAPSDLSALLFVFSLDMVDMHCSPWALSDLNLCCFL